MRRRRHVLQVSTFPFLAVLLCTMGSLILLLLVIDRRAKAVARAKAAMTVAEKMQAKAQQEKINEDEWADARRKLHASLEEEIHEVHGQAERVNQQIGTATNDLAGQQTQSRDLHKHLDAEKERYALFVNDVTARKEELAKTGKQDEATENLRRQLTADLMNLEQTLADLTALRKREQRTFSLVPYKGRRGENRKPVYLECTATGWIFHPDLKSLIASEAGVKDLRAELQSRLPSTTASKESAPYLFLLVRPDGIGNYYRAQAAMQGLPVDFGYEFVDASWILDFSQKPETAQPWMTTGPPLPGTARPPIAVASPKGGTGAQNNGFDGTTAITHESDTPHRQNGASGGGSGSGSFQRGPARVAPISGGSVTKGSPDLRGGVPGLSEGTDGLPGSPSGIAGTPGIGRSGNGPPVAALPQGTEPSSSLPASDTGSDPASSSAPSGKGGTPSSPLAPPGRGIGGEGHGQDAAVIGRPHASFEDEGKPAPAPGNPSLIGSDHQSSGGSVKTGNASSGSGTVTEPHGDTENSTSPLAPPTHPFAGATPRSPAAKTPGGTGAGTSALGATPEDEPAAGLTNPTFSRLPSGGTKATSSAAPARPARFTGNRDWIIPLECTAESVSLPGGTRVSARSLAEGDSGANALLHAVQQLIGRKQATVRTGEPPYRPQVRFMVHPDGLRVYHLAYPALEPLNIPILRQNLAPEDPNQLGAGGRKP